MAALAPMPLEAPVITMVFCRYKGPLVDVSKDLLGMPVIALGISYVPKDGNIGYIF